MDKFYKIGILLVLLFTAAMPNESFAQETLKAGKIKKFVRKGRKAYRKDEFWKAKSYYDKVVNANSQDPQHWFETGLVYFDSKVEREKSIVYFEKSLELSTDDTIPETFYYLGKAYLYNGEYEKAIESFNVFLNRVKNNKKGIELRQEVIREIEICNNGIALRGQTNYEVEEIVNLGPNVNTEYQEYAPVLTNEENLILFCSRRPPGRKKHVDGLNFEDIYFTVRTGENWGEAQMIDKSSGYVNKEINEGKQHTAPVSVSADGNILYIYKENGIWKSTKNDQGQWGIPERMNQNVNIGEATPSIFVTPDGSEMFIVGYNASDGFGGRDIYYSTKSETGGWTKPVNLGPQINTEYMEDAPYLSKDGKTLYFASNGHNTMGGYDIFKTVRDENGNWSDPVNIGAPVNSSGDDIYYVENSEGTLAFYASMRPGSYGYLDIYTARYGCKNIPTTNIKGYAVFSENNLPVNGVIKITNKETGEEMGTFATNPKTGKYSMALPPEQTYILELVIAQSRYTKIRPHTEEFFIPKQCETYNLYQEISIEYLYDESGQEYASKATFKNAMFDIESEIEKEYGISNFSGAVGSLDETQGIAGHVTHSGTANAANVEVLLMNKNHQVLRIDETDANGHFAFQHIDPKEEYIIVFNQDDAAANYTLSLGGSKENLNLSGKVYNYVNTTEELRPNQTIYLANSNKEVFNISSTGEKGVYELSANASDPFKVQEINDNYTISYNLDYSDAEIVYSAYIHTIDPNNTELTYTEEVDIIELKDMAMADSDGSNSSGNGMQDFADLLFDFDKHFLREKSKNILENLYSFMNENKNVTIRLEGHADWFGTEPYNMALSKRRAMAAHKYLIDKGISPDRIDNAWFGENKPKAPNANPDGSDSAENRQINRRVEIKIEVPEMADLYLSLQ